MINQYRNLIGEILRATPLTTEDLQGELKNAIEAAPFTNFSEETFGLTLEIMQNLDEIAGDQSLGGWVTTEGFKDCWTVNIEEDELLEHIEFKWVFLDENGYEYIEG